MRADVEVGVDRRVQVQGEALERPSAGPRMAFGEVSIEVDGRWVRAPAGSSQLEPRVFDLLLTLVERPGLTASSGHLIETVWGRGSGEALDRAIATLRQALGDDARAPRFIETVPALGYRWMFAEPPPPAWRWPSWMAAVIGGASAKDRPAPEPRVFSER